MALFGTKRPAKIDTLRERQAELARRIDETRDTLDGRHDAIALMIAEGEDAAAVLAVQQEASALAGEVVQLQTQSDLLAKQIAEREDQGRAADADGRWARVKALLIQREALVASLTDQISAAAATATRIAELGRQAWELAPSKPREGDRQLGFDETALGAPALQHAIRLALWRVGWTWAVPDTPQEAQRSYLIQDAVKAGTASMLALREAL